MSWSRWLRAIIRPPKEDGEGPARRREIEDANRRQGELEARARVVQLHLDVMQGPRRGDP